ncbi:MAG: N-acetylmuramoyl-L-alanine amidase [Deltaproteobacteria bacterium]|nr:N-acetylmuramoyl-L-alanine amidase [Deltaproteobacteria bacterium]
MRSLTLGTLLAVALVGARAQAQSQYLICVDPGHGGTDSGALGCGLSEKDINLDTALRLRTLLQEVGFNVIMTRDSDVAVALAQRTDYANAQAATRFVAIHSNAGGGTGIETYCDTAATSASEDWKLATTIQTEMCAAWPLRDRGLKQATFHVLVDTTMPATLTEMGFIDMCTPDAQYLGDGAHRQEAALAHLRALQIHLGLPVGPALKGIARGVVFEDKGVGTSDMTTRLEGATVQVVETGAQVSAEATTANWSFELPAGSYTIKASKPGYLENTKPCVVTQGQTEWCSIGLFPAQQKGTAKGIVYIERGDGSRDPLPGASVTVRQTGATASAQAGTGAWSFVLDAGGYTLEAAKVGYQSAQRSCTVSVGQESDCPIGLRPDDQPGVDAGPQPGLDVGPSPGTDANPLQPGPDAALDRPDGAVQPEPGADAATLPEPGRDAAAPGQPDGEVLVEADTGSRIPPEESGCGGCASGAGPVGWLATGLVLLAFIPRRRGRMGLLSVLAALGLAGCDASVRSSELSSTNANTAHLQARLDESSVEVQRTWLVAEGQWTAPVLAPGGDSVAFTAFGFKGLHLKPIAGGEAQTLSLAAGAGYAPRWSADGSRIAYRVPGQRFDAVPLQAVDRAGRAVRPFSSHEGLWALQRDDSIVLRMGKDERVIAQAGDDRYFAPFLTPDARHVVFNGLRTGVQVFRISDGVTIDWAGGSQPAVSEDGRWLVFTRTRDDGSRITAGELQLADLNHPELRTAAVGLGAGVIALHPGISSARNVLVYSRPQGGIWAATIRLPESGPRPEP